MSDCIRVCYVYVQRRLTIFWLRIIIKKKKKTKNRCKNIDNVVLSAYNLLRFGGRVCVYRARGYNRGANIENRTLHVTLFLR